jgi:alpha-tubulin suppressor-like RCC1 family protein
VKRRIGGLGLVALLLPACGIGGSGTLTPTVAPGIPADVRSRDGNGTVTLTWTASATGAGYTVLRSVVPAGPFFPVSVASQFRAPTTYVDTGLQNGSTYYYQVIATNPFGSSAPSAIVASTPGFKPTAISGASLSALALLPDGTVWTWGRPPVGVGSPLPVQVPDLPEITGVSCGAGHALALGSDGTVWAWGKNTLGELGPGIVGDSATPVQVPGITDAVAVAVGDSDSFVLTHDGRVLAWGGNAQGQLGTGSPNSSTPQPVPGLSGIVAIAAGFSHGIALRNDGLVFTWGLGQFGQLGNPPASITIFAPTLVSNLNGVVSIAASGMTSYALRNDGTLWGWGYNAGGQIGTGNTTSPIAAPSKVVNLTNVAAIAAGGGYALAVRSDGAVWGWGDNSAGELGVLPVNSTPVATPVQVPNLSSIGTVAATTSTSYALSKDGTLFSWGDNQYGELGNGPSGSSLVPIQLPNVTSVAAVSAGDGFTAIRKTDGSVWSLGTNANGQVGNGTTSATPVSVPTTTVGVVGPTAIAAGDSHALALFASGAVMAWGSNQQGQIGDGSSGTNVPTPKTIASLTNITAVGGGSDHSLAVRNDALHDHTVWTWGLNNYGQLGNGGIVSPNPTPTEIPGFSGAAAVGGGLSHSIALKLDGSVWTWGDNSFAQLGRGTISTTPVPTPGAVTGISGAVAVAAGTLHNVVLLADGTVRCWGEGTQGSLGDGLSTTNVSPVVVKGLSGVVAVGAGGSFSAALKSDGTVWTWGYNGAGQLGAPVGTASSVPVQVSGLTGVSSMSVGPYHVATCLTNGTVVSWGSNFGNVLGVPAVTQSVTPVVVGP